MSGLERFIGGFLVTKVAIPSDRRGETIPANTTLFVRGLVGEQHFHLVWPGTGETAASQMHYSKFYTSSVLQN